MDFSTLITILEKQHKLYSSLYQISLQKTEIVKKGDIPALNLLMKNEQKHITSITMLENQRLNEMKNLFPEQAELPTISECVELANPAQQTILQKIYTQLIDVLQKTKEQNNLNQQLLNQSLQFVNFSLNLFQPKLDNYSYGSKTGTQPQKPANSVSIFNSQA